MDKISEEVVVERREIKGKTRYVVVNRVTGEILDDAQGHGFKSMIAAWKCYRYKQYSKEEQAKYRSKIKVATKWLSEHKDLVEDIEYVAFQIIKGSYGPEEIFNLKTFTKIVESYGINESDLDFTFKELFRAYQKGKF